MKRFLLCLGVLANASSVLAVPGAKPVVICNYSMPVYSLEEVTVIRAYQACLQNVRGLKREEAREKCNMMLHNTERLIQCGRTPEFKSCSSSVEIKECTYETAYRKKLSGRYTCDEIIRRYPDLVPTMEACKKFGEAEEYDRQLLTERRTQCIHDHPSGFKLVSENCRKPTYVVPP